MSSRIEDMLTLSRIARFRPVCKYDSIHRLDDRGNAYSIHSVSFAPNDFNVLTRRTPDSRISRPEQRDYRGLYRRCQMSNSCVVPNKNRAPAERTCKIPKIWTNHRLNTGLAVTRSKNTDDFAVRLPADQDQFFKCRSNCFHEFAPAFDRPVFG